jgi:hypothetical protein
VGKVARHTHISRSCRLLMQANVVETPTNSDSCQTLQLLAHAAAAGQRSTGVRPSGGDDPAVVPPRQHDDVRGAEESTVSGLGVDGVGGDGTRAAEAHLVTSRTRSLPGSGGVRVGSW